MKNVLVTGGNGQLALCIKDSSKNKSEYNFLFLGSKELDITQKNKVDLFFKTNKIDYCINCAAYTAVDKAETESEKAYKINVDGSKNLAIACKKNNVTLIHISTDFVFDGNSNTPYTELNTTEPLGVYGKTKLQGELAIINNLERHFVIRTSWLYSEYGNNFMKTMLRLAKDRTEISVVSDQTGTPTYAKDLADAILKIIDYKNQNYGIYHYSNKGVVSWYDFAKAIFEISDLKIKVNPINTEEYPTPAKRPKFSVLDKTKTKTNLNIDTPFWKDSLKTALSRVEE